MQHCGTGPGIDCGTPLQVLWQDGDRVFCRASHDAGGGPRTVLVVAPAANVRPGAAWTVSLTSSA
jgi:hypothetical protein